MSTMSKNLTRTLFGGLVAVKKKNWVDAVEPRKFAPEELEGIESVEVIQGKWSRACLFTLVAQDSSTPQECFCITIDKDDLEKYPDVFTVGAKIDPSRLLFCVIKYVGEPNPDLKATVTPRVRYIAEEEPKVKEVTDFNNPLGLLGKR